MRLRAVPRPNPAARPAAARHVVHVIGSLNRGGAETVSLDICRAVPGRDFAQTFITLGGTEGSLAGEFRAAGAMVTQCALRPAPSFPVRLWRCLRSLRADVVVSHVGLSSGLVLAVARAAGVRTRVARMWSEGDERSGHVAYEVRRVALRKLLGYSGTDVVGVTAAALAFAGPPPGDTRYRVLYNSVDLARLGGWTRASARARWGIAPETRLLVHVGRPVEAKNRPFLLEVLRAAQRRQPGTKLLLAGPGGFDDLLGVEPGIAADEAVILAGEVGEIASVLAAADVLLLPSRREGLPGVALEALALGVPVVANDLSCMTEVAQHVRGVRLAGLAEGPDRWAEVAFEQAAAPPRERQEIRHDLARSPFLLDRAAQEWTLLWGR